MTSPLSPEAVAQMVADREAGTPGPWYPGGLLGGGRATMVYSDDATGSAVADTVLQFVMRSDVECKANARRIARLPDLEAAYLTLAAENATLRHDNDIRRQNMRDTWEAMQAMRNAINEHLPLPSLESDLLQGPENSVFCEVVATAVIGALATLRASEAAALDRVKVLTELMQWSYDTLGEINPSNYDHDGVCSLNNKSIEVILALHAALTPTADKE